MSYSYQETGGVLNQTSGGFVVAHDGEGFEPFARTLTISGRDVAYDDISVSSGGILYVGTRTVLSEGGVFASGTVTASNGAVLSDCVIHSGGTLTPTGGAQRYLDLTLEAGAKLINMSANTVFGGANTYIASGAVWVPSGASATDIWASAGVIYNFRRVWLINGVKRQFNGAALIASSGITLSNAVCDDTVIHLSSGAAVKELVISNVGATARGLIMYDGASAIDVVVAENQTMNGQLGIVDYSGEITLGGEKTDFAAGGVYYGTASQTDPDLYAAQGKLYNLNVIRSRSADETAGYLEKLTLVSGISAVSPLIGSGGSLALADGAVVEGALVLTSGQIDINSGGSGKDINISSGVVCVHDGATLAGGIVSGGTLNISAGAQAGGVTMNKATGSICVLDNAATSNFSQTAGKTFIAGGAVASNMNMGGGHNYVAAGATLVNYTATGGNTYFYDSPDAPLLVGSNTNINTIRLRYTSDAAAGLTLSVVNGEVRNLGADGKVYRLSIGDEITVSGGTVGNDCRLSAFGNAVLNGVGISATTAAAGAVLTDTARSYDAELNGSGGNAATLEVGGSATAFRTVVNSGGELKIYAGGTDSGATVGGSGGLVNVYSGGVASAARALTGGRINLNSGATGQNISISGGIIYAYSGCSVTDTELVTGGTLRIYAGATVSGAAMATGNIQLLDNAVATGLTQTAGRTYISGGAVAYDMNMGGGYNYVASGATLVNYTATGGNTYFEDNGDTPLLVGSNTNINVNRLRYTAAATTALGLSVADGVVNNLGKDGKEFRLGVGSGIVVKDAVLGGNQRLRLFDGATASNASVVAGTSAGVRGTLFASGTAEIRGAVASGALTTNRALINMYDNAVAYDVVVDNCGTLAPLADGVKAYDTLVKSGGYLVFSAGDKGRGTIENTTVLAGGTMTLNANARTGKKLTLDFTGGDTINVNDLSLINAGTEVFVRGITGSGTYTLGLAETLDRVALRLCEVASGTAAYTDGTTGFTYGFDGTTLTAADAGIAAVAAAAKLADGATTINASDKAAKWDSSTTYISNVFLADGMMAGNAWLNIDGFADNAANIYGAGRNQNFTGVVNIGANAGTVKNIAGGAGLGGKVAGVKLTIEDEMTVLGTVYAGGMGDVTGKIQTLVEGGSFTGNVFAGALCNYAANTTATSAGDIAFTANGGTFNNNLFAGAAVKAGAATGVVHTAGDITVELNGGTATKGAFCLYGGGYAAGTVEDALVYTADEVTISVAGGNWGTYLSGRGIFGGVYADKVAASVASVSISVTRGTMGNIYGGGWAQNGGTSTVTGAVSITIDGDAEVDNVFGGGSYSANSGGATRVGGVNITVAGGSVANNIFAGGQNAGSTVDGAVNVSFTGSNAYTCNVYGYTTPTTGSASPDRSLNFAGFTGAISGDIGGFTAIKLSGDTAATLSGATIDNDDWTFDYTGRTLGADAAMLTLDSGSFAGDTVAVDLATAEQAANGWSIAAGLTAADATYSVELSTGSAANLALNDALDSSYGAYEGWGFTLENDVLKFKNLA